MGLTCSVLGHDYAETEVEREREEQGSEVVVTVREIEVCSRCGERNVVSENKEVTALATEESDDEGDETPDGAIGTDEPSDEASGGAEESTSDVETSAPDEVSEPTDATAPDGTDDAEIVDAEDDAAESIGETERHETAESASGTAGDVATDEESAPTEEITDETDADDDRGEDAEIIEETADETPGGLDAEGEEPPIEEAEPGGEKPIDETEESAPESDSDAATDDGVILDETETEASEERERGEWPASDDVGPPETAEDSGESWHGSEDGQSDATEGAEAAPPSTDEPADRSASADRSETSASDAPGDAGGPTGDGRDDPVPGGSGITSAGEVPAPDDESRPGDGGEFYCPECGYSVGRERASLRVGDICPECRRGYLSER